MSLVLRFIFTILSLITADFIWLSLIAKDFYEKYLGQFLPPDDHMRWPQCAFIGVVYFLLALGLCLFVIFPAQAQKKTDAYVFFRGGVFWFYRVRHL